MPDQYSFLDYLDSIEEMMGTWDKHTAVSFSHGTNLGTAREHFVHNILASFLPTTVTVGSGEITDGDRRSGQMDVVLYRSDFPVFSGYGMPETYLFDGVIAAIEVKSRLDSDTICTALKTLSTLASSHQRVRFYPRPKELTDFTDPTTETGRLLYRNRPRTYIIAYKGWKRKDTFLKHAVSAIANSSARPDAIYQPGMCLFRHSPAHPLAISTGQPAQVDPTLHGLVTEHPFAYFFQHILQAVTQRTGGNTASWPGTSAQILYPLDSYFRLPRLEVERIYIPENITD